MKRRTFTKTGLIAGMSLGLGVSCTSTGSKKSAETLVTETNEPFFKLSLAQWSFHKAIKAKEWPIFDFAKQAKELGFSGLEYVSTLYSPFMEKFPNQTDGLTEVASRLKAFAKANKMENLLIMVDGEGDLGVQNESDRLRAVSNHHKWIDMAKEIGCHSIRLNLFGDGTYEQQIESSSDSMRRLCEYSKRNGINILVENHGGFSSDPKWTTQVMKNVNMPNCGTLPDFGNFCIEREGGERWDAKCINFYDDIYGAVNMMMPYAKAVSAKSYAFDEEGNETKIDYKKMLKVVKKSGYKGYIGVEYEGDLAEKEGIIKTRDLLLKVSEQI